MGRLKALDARVEMLEARVRPAPKIADVFYHSREWRALVAAVKRARGAWCQRCGSGHRIIGDHVVERKDGGADLDPANIELLCAACHNAKTARAKARRAGLARG